MKNKIIFGIFALLLVISSSFVYSANQIDQTKFLCEKSFGAEGYSCITTTSKEITDKKLDCHTGKACNNKKDYCCGTASNLFCCKSKESTAASKNTQTTVNAFDFLAVPGINGLINNYASLTIPKSSNLGIGYADIVERATDNGIRADALYNDALTYKTIAILRREYLGVPLYKLEEEPGKISLKETTPITSQEIPAPVLPDAPAASFDLTDKACGGTAGYKCVFGEFDKLQTHGYSCLPVTVCGEEFSCCKSKESTATETKKETKQVQPYVTTNDIIIKAGESFYEGLNSIIFSYGVWSWCKTKRYNMECSDKYIPISKENQVLVDLADKGYEEGIDSLLFALIRFKVVSLKRGDEINLFIPRLSTKNPEYNKITIKYEDEGTSIVLEVNKKKKCNNIVNLIFGTNTFINEEGIQRTELQDIKRNAEGYKCSLNEINKLVQK